MSGWIPIEENTELPTELPGPHEDGWRLQTTGRDGTVWVRAYVPVHWTGTIAYRFIQIPIDPYVPPKQERMRSKVYAISGTVTDVIEWREGDIDPDEAIEDRRRIEAAREYGNATVNDTVNNPHLICQIDFEARFRALVRILNGESE